MKLKSGSKLILKMDRAEAEAAARAAATEAETQRAKFLTDKKPGVRGDKQKWEIHQWQGSSKRLQDK
jgi:hypothetical protein